MSERLTLLPCPACGDQPVAYEVEDPRCVGFSCKCGLTSPQSYETKGQPPLWNAAASAWNSLPRALVWTTEPPKEAGQYYWALYQNLMVGAVQVVRIHGELHALIAGSKNQCPLSDFIQWAGPIPTPREHTE